MTNTNWHPMSYCFKVITDYWSNLGYFAFWSPYPLWGA